MEPVEPTWCSDFNLFSEELETNFSTFHPIGEAEAELNSEFEIFCHSVGPRLHDCARILLAQTKVGYVDDINFFTEGPTFNAMYAMLSNMMTHDGGGQEWSRNHNSKFERSKLTLVGFSHWHIQDPAHPGRTMAEPWPNLMLGDMTIKLAKLHKLCWGGL